MVGSMFFGSGWSLLRKPAQPPETTGQHASSGHSTRLRLDDRRNPSTQIDSGAVSSSLLD